MTAESFDRAPRHRFVALDSLRGVAAVGVMFFHFGNVGLISSLPLLRQGFVFVDFFFVLSGFVIAAAYGEALARGFSRATFMALRLARVYPLHIVVVAGFLLARMAAGGGSSIADRSGPEYLLRAILLLDGYFPGELNYYSAASWSISVELAAYALAALLFGRGRRGLAVAGLIWLVAVGGYLAGIDRLVFGGPLQTGLIGFGIGASAWWAFRRSGGQRISRWLTAAEVAVLLAAGLAISALGHAGWRLLVCDLTFAAVVLVFARDGGAMSRALATPPMQALGRWSYSIYLNHLLVVMLAAHGLRTVLSATGHADLVSPSGGAGFEMLDFGLWGDTALTLLAAAGIFALSALTYRFVEEPARQWAKRRAAASGHGDRERIAPTF